MHKKLVLLKKLTERTLRKDYYFQLKAKNHHSKDRSNFLPMEKY